jgi:steroid 5-alpha reductase family enzyme
LHQVGEQPQHFTGLDVAGFAVYSMGYFFEHLGDLELTAFKVIP